MQINFELVKTRVVNPPKDEIWDIIDSLKVEENDIVFITSKILALHQGRTIKADNLTKADLLAKETDRILNYHNEAADFNAELTITNGILIPAAGIDASNANGYYIYWPKDIDKLCREIRERLVKKHNLKNLGIVATDSHSTPLRYGVTGFAIGLAGVAPLKDIRGDKDLFGREIHCTTINQIDPLTSMAVALMGETNACTPIAILKNYQDITFDENASMEDLKVPLDQDLYKPLLDVIK